MTEFAESSDYRGWGPGRVVFRDDAAGTVEIDFFVSPTEGFHQVTVEADSVRGVQLQRQTTVYVIDPESGNFTQGRLYMDGEVDANALDPERYPDLPEQGRVYVVKFPKGLELAVPPERVYVRWSKPLESPVPWLASHCHQGSYLYKKRFEVLSEILNQRSVFAGLTGLASSSVELMEHQFDVVRKVLHDPIMRYVLADEVGLGKTIEAGIIIRQHLLDAHEPRVLVLAPEHLVAQWTGELTGMFGLSKYLERSVKVRSASDVSSALDAFEATPSMLVVDEAHQLASMAHQDEGRPNYAAVAALTQKVKHVLLLSATPVIRNEEGFLAMLHLLDPAVYQLDEIDDFKDLISKSTKIGELVTRLRPQQNPYLLRDTLQQLTDFATDGDQLGALMERLEALVDEDRDLPERMEAISALRLHLKEVYRVHERLVRSSRDDPTVSPHLPSGRKLEAEPYDNEPYSDAYDFLEDWRWAVVGASVPTASSFAKGTFAAWVDASLVHPSELCRDLQARLDKLRDGTADPLFDDEEDMLAGALTKIGGRQFATRPALVQEIRSRTRGFDRKAVVFTSSTDRAEHLCKELTDALGPRVAQVSPQDPNVGQRFIDDPRLQVLVVDEKGEEGLNLQRAQNTVAVHADLPMSPIRVEQRLGRLDRIHATAMTVVSSVRYLDEGYEGAVLRFLKASGVFESSVAPVQFLLKDVLAHVRDQLLERGVEAIDDACRDMREREHEFSLEEEKDRSKRLRILDEMERPQTERVLYEHLEDYAYGGGAEAFEKGVRSWLGPGCLNLDDIEESTGVRFKYWGRSLLPKSQFRECFRSALEDSKRTHCVVFDRDKAIKVRQRLARVGSPLIEAVERQARADERGMAYSIWRQAQSLGKDFEPAVHFRFDFLVEAALDRDKAALRRIADRILPPRLETVWINPQLCEEEDERYLEILRVEIKSGRLGTRDETLRAGETWTRAEEVLGGRWADLCTMAEDAAREIIAARPSIEELVASAIEKVRVRHTRTATILNARAGRMTGVAPHGVVETIEQEKQWASELERAVAEPRRILQFCGAIVLSNKELPAGDEDL